MKNVKKIVSVILAVALAIGTVSPAASAFASNGASNATSFSSDFTTTDGWTGDTSYIFTDKPGFGSIKSGNEDPATITTVNKYDFGTNFEASFDLYYEATNSSLRNNWPTQTGHDYSIYIGEFEIQIKNYQSEIVVLYKEADINGTSSHNYTSTDKNFYYQMTRTFKIDVEDGNITVKSCDKAGTEWVSYTGTVPNFEAVNDATISLKRVESWQVAGGSLVKNFSVQAVTDSDDGGAGDDGSDETRPTSFSTDFTTTEEWSGDTDKINTSKGRFESVEQTQPGITTVNNYDFSDTFDANFDIYYEIANGALMVNHAHVANPATGTDIIITIGRFEILIKNYQTEVEVLYDGADIGGTSKCNVTKYKSYFTNEYNIHIEPGKISIKSYDTTTSELAVEYTSTFSDFDAVNDAQVGIKWNETWQLQGTPFIKDFSVQAVADSGDGGSGDAGSDQKRANSFTHSFTTTEGWTGDTDKINTNKGRFESVEQTKPGITTVNSYDFGEKFDANFSIYYEIANGALKVNGEHVANPATGIDMIITIGKFAIQIKNYQTEIVVLYDGVDIGGTSKCNVTSYKSYFAHAYEVHIEQGKISITSYDATSYEMVVEYTSNFSDFEAVNNAKVGIKWNETWQLQGTPYIKDFSVKAATASTETTGEKRATGFASDFKTKDDWSGDLDYIFIDKRGFGSSKAGNEPVATITTVDRFDFGDKFDASFILHYGAANNGFYESNGYKRPYPTGNDYIIKIGDFVIQIWNYQSEVKILYRGRDIGGTSKCYDKSYAGGALNYKIHFERGKISVTAKNEFDEIKLKYTSKFSDFEAVNNAEVTLVRRESWQITSSYIKKLRVGTPVSKNSKYKSLYSFNAVDDFKKILEADDAATALIKSQWNIWQKTSEKSWTTDDIKKKQHISGFYSTIPTEPNAIPVIQTLTESIASEVGVYLKNMILRTTHTTKNKRTTALSFEVPASGRIRLYDPEEGMLSIAGSLNKTTTWCMNNDAQSVKSCYVAIYKNDEKIWPEGQDEFLFANDSHKKVTTAITETDFPDLLIDVEQGDMIYITVRPDHYKVETGAISAQNPTAITMNPQIDYIRIDGEMKLNTDRELTKDDTISVSSRIKTKSAAIRALEYESMNRGLIFAGIASGVFVIFMTGATVYMIKRRRRTTV